MTCGQCLGGAQCDHINGVCPKGCDPGWETDMCDTGRFLQQGWMLTRFK